MTPALTAALERLSTSQRIAVDWQEGAALVLAGPGVGKTTVLTTRVARLLNDSPKRNFRLLALTFTTKAGDEMRSRIEELVPGMTERVTVGTFHSFCAQMLRQHGSHLGIRPDFGVYDETRDYEELLRDGLRAAMEHGEPVSLSDVRWLGTINQLRANIVSPSKSASRFRDTTIGAQVARVYAIYEATLRERNVMDFNGMILDTCRLAHQVPAVAARTRQTYPYWLVDEFQDTTPAQYRLLKFLAGDVFRNIFAVADDDQIIFQWAGASYRQIVTFRSEFQPHLIQLVENRRCPPDVVRAANNLVAHNKDRTPDKHLLVALRPQGKQAISLRVFKTDSDEATGLASEIAASGSAVWGQTAVLARTRDTLVPILKAMKLAGVKALISARRDGFVSPQFTWLYALLDQSLRPTDQRVFMILVIAANRMTGDQLDPAFLLAEASAAAKTPMEVWALAMHSSGVVGAKELAQFGLRLIQSRSTWKPVLAEAIAYLTKASLALDGILTDVADDEAAWKVAAKAIRAEKGGEPDLPELLQGIALRPKEPPQDPGAVILSTIHSSKGLEFNHVWVVGLAEGLLPSWQSLKMDARPADLEEERRNCFVAITRTKQTLVLSRADTYQGRPKPISRFIAEMRVAGGE